MKRHCWKRNNATARSWRPCLPTSAAGRVAKSGYNAFSGEKDAQSCHSCDTCQALGSNRIRPLREEEIVILQKALSGSWRA